MKKSLALFGVLGAFATPHAVFAASLLDETKDIDVHAFLTQGFIKATDDINYLANSGLGSFEYTEAGINFTKQLDDNLRTGLQLLARRIGPDGDFVERLDWFYLDYHWSDWLGLRVGRVKIPFGLYNTAADTDSARVPILLPQGIYPSQDRTYLLAQNGLDLYGYRELGFGGLEYEAYGGTIFIALSDVNPPVNPVISSLDVPYVVGGRVLWDTPIEGLRIGPTFQALRLDLSEQVGPLTGSEQAPVMMWIGSAEYEHNDLSLALEYSHWYGAVTNSTNPLLAMNSGGFSVSERSYIMGAYRLTSWLQPGVYYARYLPNLANTSGQENYQHDLAATLRFDINRFWLVKLEGHYMIGTAELTPSALAPSNSAPPSQLAGHWGAFLVDTTAYF